MARGSACEVLVTIFSQFRKNIDFTSQWALVRGTKFYGRCHCTIHSEHKSGSSHFHGYSSAYNGTTNGFKSRYVRLCLIVDYYFTLTVKEPQNCDIKLEEKRVLSPHKRLLTSLKKGECKQHSVSQKVLNPFKYLFEKRPLNPYWQSSTTRLFHDILVDVCMSRGRGEQFEFMTRESEGRSRSLLRFSANFWCDLDTAPMVA